MGNIIHLDWCGYGTAKRIGGGLCCPFHARVGDNGLVSIYGRNEMGFETKDSGKRQQFESGMQRDTEEGKIKYSLALDGPMFKRYAELMTRGAVKYEARNWMKATGEAELERFKESALRHFLQWYSGETDEDHGAAVFFNINGAEYVQERLREAEYDKERLNESGI